MSMTVADHLTNQFQDRHRTINQVRPRQVRRGASKAPPNLKMIYETRNRYVLLVRSCRQPYDFKSRPWLLRQPRTLSRQLAHMVKGGGEPPNLIALIKQCLRQQASSHGPLARAKPSDRLTGVDNPYSHGRRRLGIFAEKALTGKKGRSESPVSSAKREALDTCALGVPILRSVASLSFLRQTGHAKCNAH